jgi:hypothetical protein
MCSKLLLASVATIGLLLTGPQKASAQVLNACISSIGNISILAGPNAPCPGGTKTTLSQTPGAVAARQYSCVIPQNGIVDGGDIAFFDSGIGFGTTLPTGTIPFASFFFQPGFYQVSLNITPRSALLLFNPTLSFGSFPSATWNMVGAPVVNGDRFFSVTNNNTGAALIYHDGGAGPVSLVSPCLLTLTQLQ